MRYIPCMGGMVAEVVVDAEDKLSSEALKVSTKDRIDSHQKRLKLRNADQVVAFMLDFYESHISTGGKGIEQIDGVHSA